MHLSQPGASVLPVLDSSKVPRPNAAHRLDGKQRYGGRKRVHPGQRIEQVEAVRADLNNKA